MPSCPAQCQKEAHPLLPSQPLCQQPILQPPVLASVFSRSQSNSQSFVESQPQSQSHSFFIQELQSQLVVELYIQQTQSQSEQKLWLDGELQQSPTLIYGWTRCGNAELHTSPGLHLIVTGNEMEQHWEHAVLGCGTPGSDRIICSVSDKTEAFHIVVY